MIPIETKTEVTNYHNEVILRLDHRLIGPLAFEVSGSNPL